MYNYIQIHSLKNDTVLKLQKRITYIVYTELCILSSYDYKEKRYTYYRKYVWCFNRNMCKDLLAFI